MFRADGLGVQRDFSEKSFLSLPDLNLLFPLLCALEASADSVEPGSYVA